MFFAQIVLLTQTLSMRIFGARTSRPAAEHQREIRKTDVAVSKMMRARDRECSTCGSDKEQMNCGYFRRRELTPTRFHPMNLNSQGVKQNRFEGGRAFEYGQAMNKKYGEGWAAFLNELSKKIEAWSVAEFQQLRSAARMGIRLSDSFILSFTLTTISLHKWSLCKNHELPRLTLLDLKIREQMRATNVFVDGYSTIQMSYVYFCIPSEGPTHRVCWRRGELVINNLAVRGFPRLKPNNVPFHNSPF
jgi:hypothetical protein